MRCLLFVRVLLEFLIYPCLYINDNPTAVLSAMGTNAMRGSRFLAGITHGKTGRHKLKV